VAVAHGLGQLFIVSRIVVIEDHVDTAELLREVLHQMGHQVEAAHTGKAGIAAARRMPADVVLCDVGLPDMDGYAVARELRHGVTAHARLIVMTGYDSDEDRQRAYEAGFELHVAKPVDLDAIERLFAAPTQPATSSS
jgi:two-component system CheB/CheR fusion protein